MATRTDDPFAGPEDDEASDQTLQFQRPSQGSGKAVFPTLRVVGGPDLFLHAMIGPGEVVVIGRDPSAGLRLPDNAVSKRHLEVGADERGRVWAHDLRSTNGTLMNGAPLDEAYLSVGDRLVIGAFELRLDMMTLEEVALLRRVGQRLAVADRDPLTGLLTRSWMQDELAASVARSETSGQPISVIYVDIDHFKQVNDSFGHAVGDAVLRATGGLLLAGVRDRDVCVRYGGEELVVFLPSTGRALAAEIAERLRRAIAAHPWAEVVPGLAVRASFGVAERRGGEASTEWLGRADRALYASKHGGRDRVSTAD
jgi:diguanylate cyclase (GGDEF)-like protein